jgi:hypothetical protein
MDRPRCGTESTFTSDYFFANLVQTLEFQRCSQPSQWHAHCAKIGVRVATFYVLAESEKWRLRSIHDGKTNLLEVGNPPDPLSSRIWMAPSLLRLASGELSSLKYSSLELSDDSKPKFLVNSLKRKSIGLIIEEDEDAKSDTLVVDEEGFAKTRISGAETQELVYKFGKLP